MYLTDVSYVVEHLTGFVLGTLPGSQELELKDHLVSPNQWTYANPAF